MQHANMEYAQRRTNEETVSCAVDGSFAFSWSNGIRRFEGEGITLLVIITTHVLLLVTITLLLISYLWNTYCNSESALTSFTWSLNYSIIECYYHQIHCNDKTSSYINKVFTSTWLTWRFNFSCWMKSKISLVFQVIIIYHITFMQSRWSLIASHYFTFFNCISPLTVVQSTVYISFFLSTLNGSAILS